MGEVDVLPPRQVVVSALPLRRKQFAVLAEQLGPQFRVVDIRDAPEHVDVVLCPPCSPQTIGRLRETFPTARVVALELNDPDSGLRIDGPVGRVLSGGAAGYLVASSAQSVAQYLAATAETEEVEAARTAAITGPTVDDLVVQQIEALAARRAR